MDPKIVAALISAVVSLITVFLAFVLKTWFERHFVIFKLEAEHEYDQKKRTKEIIARNKTQLLNAAESLNYRLWNFSENYNREWHKISDMSTLPDQYYLASFTYRFLAFLAWVRRIETQMIYLDTTIASRIDLHFLKYLKILIQVMCDDTLFKGLAYDTFRATDHFFRNDFIHMCECFVQGDEVVTYAAFKRNENHCCDEAIPVARFLNGISPDEKRFRWDRLQAFHYLLLMFLNTYGYDFMYTNKAKIRSLVSKSPRQNKTLVNLRYMLSRMYLDKQKEAKKILAQL